MQALSSELTPPSHPPLQLLLFADRRPSSWDQIQQIRDYLQTLKASRGYDLQVIDIEKQPYLVEHFKLVVTPALVKVHPGDRQVLAGSDLIQQLDIWWPRWQHQVEEHLDRLRVADPSMQASDFPNGSRNGNPVYSGELMQLSDRIFHLSQEKEELQEQVLFKDRLIAMLAHDLRSPLTALSIALETLEMGQELDDGEASRLSPELRSQLLKQARSQARTIERMITDILQAARGSETNFRLKLHKLDLAKLCQEVMIDLQYRFQQKAQTIETDIPQDLACVYGDTERLRQVLVNLLSNASKYTPSNGIIQLSILHRTTQKVQVSICDNGPGVPEENHDRIFEDRFRLKRDKEQDGYGIGLSLCRRIIRAHYGRIWVDSDPGQGSCFHFTLPVSPV